MMRSVLVLGATCLVLGCGSIDEQEVQDAAEVTQRTVQRGVAGAKRGAEVTWDAATEVADQAATQAMDALERRKRRQQAEAEAEAASPPVDPFAGAAEAIVCEEPGVRCTVTAELAARARQHTGVLSQQASLRPVRSPAVGLRVDGMKAGSIPELMGFAVGDVVTHVNGVAVGSMRDAMLLYMNVRAARHFEVHYLRGEDERMIVVDVV
ncbi:MAG: hypothetical protein AB1Z98_14615 [Nannocystaceae bacterium]